MALQPGVILVLDQQELSGMEGRLRHGQAIGLLPVLGVLCWESCQAGGLGTSYQSPGGLSRVIPAWQRGRLGWTQQCWLCLAGRR